MRSSFLRGFLAVNLILGFVPVVGVLLHTRYWLHLSADLVQTPDRGTLALLGAVGVAVPLVALIHVVRRLVHDNEKFRILELSVAYLSLALVFAAAFFLLQVASPEGAFEGMTRVWPQRPTQMREHTSSILAAFADAGYLSVTTLTTVGYGDLTPISPWARLIASTESLAGVGFIGLVLGHYFSYCTHHRYIDVAPVALPHRADDGSDPAQSEGYSGIPASIQATSRARSSSLGLGPSPMGNCVGGGQSPQSASFVDATPQRIVADSLTTPARTEKSRPCASPGP